MFLYLDLGFNWGVIRSEIKQYFNGIDNYLEMNGGKKRFEIKEVEIYELL